MPLAAGTEIADVPVEAWVRSGTVSALHDELAKLPLIEREVLTLFYLRELSLGEVADCRRSPRYRQITALSRQASAAAGTDEQGSAAMKISAKEMQEMAADRMSMGSRLRYTGVLLVGLGGAALVGSLWATEPALADRTRIAFALLLAINLAWAASRRGC